MDVRGRNHVVVTGRHDGPVLMPAHGFGRDQNLWRQVVPALARVFARATFPSHHRADLARVTVPTLVVQCSEDAPAPPEVGAFVHARIAGSEPVTLDATGHRPQPSAPGAMTAAITAFAGGSG